MRKSKRRILNPYQYRLRLRTPYIAPPLPLHSTPKPYILFKDGEFHIYRNKWKSQFRGPNLWAACISAPTIPELQIRIRKAYNGWKYGANFII